MRVPTRIGLGVAAMVVLGVLCCCGGATLYFFDINGTSPSALDGACLVNSSVTTGQLPDLAPLTDAQDRNAATIVTVGQRLKVPPRGWIVAVATAMQESHLRNLPDLDTSNDHDSLGLFQQRPSQGWGTPEQIMDPVYAATKFYTKLLTVTGWQAMALTDAAQAVQHSAFPDAYAKWEPDATQLVGVLVADSTGSGSGGLWSGGSGSGGLALGGLGGICPLDGGDLQLAAGAVNLPAGYSLPPGTPVAITKAITWALGQIGTPYSFGGSCTASHSGSPALECDCSSLTMMAYRAGGVSLPRLAAEQSRVGTPIYDLRALLPGDLLFLIGSDGTRTAPGHVGMYLGDGVLIEAPHTGTVVHLTTLGAWSTAIVAVRRIVK